MIMKKIYTLFLFSFFLATQTFGQAILTAVYDGPLGGGTPKGVEIYVTQDIPDLTLLGVSSANNGTGPTVTPEFFMSGTATAGDYIYVATESDSFTAFFGFFPDFEADAMGINGDDAIELFYNNVVIDVFGDVNVDGSGSTWEYQDSWAARLPASQASGDIFDEGAWFFGGVDTLDGERTNATAMYPVPVKSFTNGMANPDFTISVVSNQFIPAIAIVDQGDIVQWNNQGGNHNVNGLQSVYPNNSEDFFSGAASTAAWSFQHTFNNAGFNDYQCDPHVGLGMVGGILVQESGDHYVEVENNVYLPKDITIQVGESVVWNNISGNHNVNGSTATFPNNPESFSNGPASQNWTFKHTFDTPGTYDYQCDPHVGFGMVGTVTVEGPEYLFLDIEDIRMTNADGTLMYNDSLVFTGGIVHGINLRPSGLQFTIIEPGNFGVGVFSGSENFGYIVNEGDSVLVTGAVGQFNGLAQIYIDGLEAFGNGPAYEPVVVTALDESTESGLVRINGLIVVDPTDWPNPGSSGNVDVTDGTNTFNMRIDNDVQAGTVPEGTFDLIGLGGQFDNSSPYDEGYQILPRDSSDVIKNSATFSVAEIGIDHIYPNPVEDILTIEADRMIDQIMLCQVDGKVINRSEINNQVAKLNMVKLSSGTYVLHIKVGEKWGSKKVMKK